MIILFTTVIAIIRWSSLPGHKPVDGELVRMPQISIVLPTWNEEKVIEAKLADILSQDYPKECMEIIVIDAASSDNTIPIVENWITNNDLGGSKLVKIIKEEERKGKSVSINTAFKVADEDSEILMMSDVDCRLSSDALSKIANWFRDQDIGAVTGRQVLLNSATSKKTREEESYRDFFTRIRLAESNLHSTPIFHGECAAYRRKAIENHKLIENANADDSQMAVCSIRSGYRAIYDSEIIFFEMAPSDGKASRIQKVRRAQGLVRHFWRNFDMLFDNSFGQFRKALALEFSLHILCPIFVVLGFLSGFSHIIITTMEINFDLGNLLTIGFEDLVMLSIDSLVLFLLLSGFLNLPIPFSKVTITFFSYMLTLFWAQTLIIFGKSLHKWQQVPTVRDSLMIHDKNS